MYVWKPKLFSETSSSPDLYYKGYWKFFKLKEMITYRNLTAEKKLEVNICVFMNYLYELTYEQTI